MKSEAQTRSELIDTLLAQAGWNVKDPTQVAEEFDILTARPDGVAEPHITYSLSLTFARNREKGALDLLQIFTPMKRVGARKRLRG